MTLEGLDGERLAAVSAIWKRERREIVTRFGGTSMLPAIPPGAEVRVACGGRVAPGDVAVVLSGGRIVVHRVAARLERGGWILTRGDATAVPDLPVREADAVGRVDGVGRNGIYLPVPSPPDSPARRAALAACLFLLRASPAAGKAFVHALWLTRRLLLVYPAVACRRLSGNRGASPGQKEQAEPGEPERQ